MTKPVFHPSILVTEINEKWRNRCIGLLGMGGFGAIPSRQSNVYVFVLFDSIRK